MAKTITLQYEATCKDPKCGKALPVGHPARWYGRGRVYGIGCHDDARNGDGETTAAAATQAGPSKEPPAIGTRPAWAQALIVAELEVNQSEAMTDYFATKTDKTVPLAWSRHVRNNFTEMRNAAALFEPTAHLGPGLDIWTARAVYDIPPPGYFVDNGITFHHEDHMHDSDYEAKEFTTETEAQAYVAERGAIPSCWHGETLAAYKWRIAHTSVEHRDNYSMGAGYYLKRSGHYSTAWRVRKITYNLDTVPGLKPPAVNVVEISGNTYTRNARGRCEDAPCCGCCTI